MFIALYNGAMPSQTPTPLLFWGRWGTAATSPCTPASAALPAGPSGQAWYARATQLTSVGAAEQQYIDTCIPCCTVMCGTDTPHRRGGAALGPVLPFPTVRTTLVWSDTCSSSMLHNLMFTPLAGMHHVWQGMDPSLCVASFMGAGECGMVPATLPNATAALWVLPVPRPTEVVGS